MEWPIVGAIGIVLLILILLSQITSLKQQNASLRRENIELKSLLISNRQVEPLGHFSCLWVFLLLFLATLTCISIPGCTTY
jgi:hypothetical protein